MKIRIHALLFIGLFGIFGLLYFKVHVQNVIAINPRFRPVIQIYHNFNDMDSSDDEEELPNVKFTGMNVRNRIVIT